ncbi:MerR family transcriptional regulator [Rhodococcus gannanensis]|uniref:MerR family transcriptional regulator n=1 Tax=Rhodococcus gannanensis TaxID=1960308 RepID=A0ABW4P2T6_9NOCA
MDADTSLSIGDLARRTGLTVKTIRYYADTGIVPPTSRSSAGHRRYGADAVVRLEFVRTLRDLGLDLESIRKVVDREAALADVAETHAEALAVQIRLLRTRRALLLAVAARGSTTEAMTTVPALAAMAEGERHALIDAFLDGVFGGAASETGVPGIMRTLTPELPDFPEPEQITAWVELAEPMQDIEFRNVMTGLADHFAADRAHSVGVHRDTAAVIRDLVGPALAANVAPAAPEATAVVDEAVASFARTVDLPVGPRVRRQLLDWLALVQDPRRERYLERLAVVNGWSAPESLSPVFAWLERAVSARE